MDIDIEDNLFDDAVLFAAIAIVKEEVMRKQDRKTVLEYCTAQQRVCRRTTLVKRSVCSRISMCSGDWRISLATQCQHHCFYNGDGIEQPIPAQLRNSWQSQLSGICQFPNRPLDICR